MEDIRSRKRAGDALVRKIIEPTTKPHLRPGTGTGTGTSMP